MRQSEFVVHGFKAGFVLMLLLGISTSVYAKNKDCWAEFYQEPHYKGEQFRLKGPAKLKNLHNVNGGDWDKRIESVVVGPKATLTVFENKNFKLTLKEMANHPVLMKSLGITKQDILEDSELIFKAGSKIHNFGDFRFYHKIRSLKIKCVR